MYPLWADAQATQSNIRADVLQALAKALRRSCRAEDVIAYIAAVMAHPAFTARFKADLVRPGLRMPLTADKALFDEAAALGREVVWLHCYGERFVDTAAGRPKGPPRLPTKRARPFPRRRHSRRSRAAAGDMAYDAAKQRLVIGKGFVENITPAMRNYEISGKNVLDQWFSYRRRDRTKPMIGDRRPPSPLEKIQPDGWLAEYTEDLLNLLNVLGRLVALEPRQADLLERIVAGPLVALAREANRSLGQLATSRRNSPRPLARLAPDSLTRRAAGHDAPATRPVRRKLARASGRRGDDGGLSRRPGRGARRTPARARQGPRGAELSVGRAPHPLLAHRLSADDELAAGRGGRATALRVRGGNPAAGKRPSDRPSVQR